MMNINFKTTLFLFFFFHNSIFFLLTGMQQEITIPFRDFNTFKFWSETEKRYKFNCPIFNCRNNNNKGFSKLFKLENHVLCQHHICPCCDNIDTWESVDDLLVHFIEWHRSRNKSHQGKSRNCFVCELCNEYITLFPDHLNRHKETCQTPRKNKNRKVLRSPSVLTTQNFICKCSPEYFLPNLFYYD